MWFKVTLANRLPLTVGFYEMQRTQRAYPNPDPAEEGRLFRLCYLLSRYVTVCHGKKPMEDVRFVLSGRSWNTMIHSSKRYIYKYTWILVWIPSVWGNFRSAVVTRSWHRDHMDRRDNESCFTCICRDQPLLWGHPLTKNTPKPEIK